MCWGDPANSPIINSNTGRKRLNILGSYNPDTHTLVHLTGEENCDAERIKDFFELILERYSSAPKIILFLNYAKYHKAESVFEWLKDHPKLQVEFLLTYAPNLNLIERFWKFAKQKLVRNNYYEKYKTFRATVFQFLNNVHKYFHELKTLTKENTTLSLIVPIDMVTMLFEEDTKIAALKRQRHETTETKTTTTKTTTEQRKHKCPMYQCFLE